MSRREAVVREYYSAPPDCFWQWQDEGTAVGWRDGKTISFDQELTYILKQMAPTGLPRFGALLLLVAATRKNWAVDGTEAGLLTAMASATPGVKQDEWKSDQEHTLRHSTAGPVWETKNKKNRLALVERVLAGLHRVRALDSSLRGPLEAKAALASIVFADPEPAVPPKDAPHVADAIRPGLLSIISSTADATSSGRGPIMLLRDLADLAAGLERVTPEVVRLRTETGLDELPAPALFDEEESEELSPSDSARALIDELIDSPEHAGMAKLAKLLLASTTLPRKLSESQEQEMGGYSDIANRGTPDRLLLSELAQDGLTLAVRVAMNEAMYLHRETPPSAPRLRRELLLDSGVHAWGLPRVFAASAALALAANTPVGASFAAWRGSGDTLCEVDLATKPGFVDHLAALEPDPHLADALPRFASLIGESADPVEAILLMPAEAYADHAVVEQLRGLSAERVYVATVDRDGEFRLCERGPRGEKLLRSARLPLDQLFTRDESLKGTRDLERLPAIFRVAPFPLRMPVQLDEKNCWTVGSWGALSISGDGRLMRWTSPKKGAEQISDQMPKGKLWWASPECVQGKTSFVYGPSQKPVYYELDITRGELQSTPINCSVSTGVTFHNGALFCLQPKAVTAVNPQTGEAGPELAIPKDLSWIGGRFYQCTATNDWHALSHDGHAASIDPLPGIISRYRGTVHVWEAVGISEPFALTSNGQLMAISSNSDKLPRPLKRFSNCSVVQASHDGLRLVIRGEEAGLRKTYALRLDSPAGFEQVYAPGIDPRVQQVARPGAIRNRFQAMGLTEEGGALALRSTKSVLVLEKEHGMPVFRQRRRGLALICEQAFTENEPLEGLRIKLTLAQWPSGDRAVLDSRGLLHLQPADSEQPETTLVVAEGELTGWRSDGQFFGKEYFLPEGEETGPRARPLRQIYESTVVPFLENLRANP